MQPFDLLASPLDGTNLIEASAGTGKTYTIASLYLRFIVEKGLSPEKILVVTFTEAATKELRDRIRRKLRDAVEAFGGAQTADAFLLQLVAGSADRTSALRRLTEALRDFDQATIFTIHGFCQRTLHENAFESSSLFDTALVTSQEDLKREIVEDFWRLHFYQAPPAVVRYALARRYSPAAFFQLAAAKSACHPDLKVIPQIVAPSMETLRCSVEALAVGVQQLEPLWRASREEVAEQLRSPGLRGNSIYRGLEPKEASGGKSDREVKITELLQDMETFLRAKDPGFPFPLAPQFEAFTSSKLESSTKKKYPVPSHGLFHLCDDITRLAATVEEILEQYFLNLKHEVLHYVNQELPLRKQRQNIQHFDDLLLKLKQGLEQAGGAELAQAVRSKYQAALIDEFQDTDPIQYAIFHNVFAGQERCLFLIGDPKQAIYSFRGADIFTYMKAAGNADRTYTLATNWRSEPDLIAAVNTLFAASPNPFVYPEIGFAPVSAPAARERVPLTLDGQPQAPLELWFLGAEPAGDGAKPLNKTRAQELIRAALAAEMARLLRLSAEGQARIGDRPLREGDFAVLVRANREAREIKEALAAVNIASVLHSTEDVFDAPEAEQLERLLLAVAEPQREGLVRAALATDLLGASGEDLARWMRDETRWEEWVLQFRSYLELWSAHGFMRMFRQFMVEQRVRSRLLSLSNGERRITNVLHLSEVLHQESVERKLGVTELLKWLSEQRDRDFRGAQEHQLRLESDENAVKLVTIHKSKGLEYPIVFCPFTWGSSKISSGTAPLTFHDENDERRLTLDLGSAERDVHRIHAEKELLAENMRLLYVALTRAQKRCILVWGRFNTAETSALAYLLHTRGAPEAVDVVSDTANAYKSLTDASMRAQLQEVAEQAGGAIHLLDMDLEPGTAYHPPTPTREELRPRRFTGKIERDWRVSSFSALTSNLVHGVELPDRDARDQPAPEGPKEAGQRPAPEAPLDIFAFPRGAKAGTLLHDILEHFDFTAHASAALEGLVTEKLQEYGFEAKWQATVCSMVRRVLTAPLGREAETFTLASIANEQRLNELEFYFPLESLTPGRLQQAFADAGDWGADLGAAAPVQAGAPSRNAFPGMMAPPVAPGAWLEQLGRLNFQPVRGFIKGFMDLVFRCGERFYLVDWKSNHLGNRVADYGPEALAAAMQREYYVLQYYLYTVALDRYLALRLTDYHYDAHFGGVFYMFLRGVDPDAGPRFGVFHDRPRRALVQALAAALGVGRTK